MNTSFFLGANSAHGFHSYYNELIDLKTAQAVYILKGGPGSGKSSLMKKVAGAAEECGLDVERIYCSSDPESLDAIVIPALSKAIVDGTAPHIVEPTYPLAVERYVNLGQFAEYLLITRKKDEIISAKEKYSGYFKHIYKLTAAAGHIDNEMFDIALGGISIDKLHAKADGIISRELRGHGNGGNTKNRFLSAISPKGYVSLFSETAGGFSRIFCLEDSFGLSHFLLSPILKAAEAKGFACTVCRNPLIPERIEHLIIPELSLAFVTSSKENPYNGEIHRKVRIDQMISNNIRNSRKQQILRLKKLKASILSDVFELLREAKEVHDELEDLYNPHIRFDDLYEYADMLICEIFSK